MYYLLMFIIFSMYCAEHDAFPPLDRAALIAMPVCQELFKASQDEKDKFLRDHLGTVEEVWSPKPHDREKTAIALLAGANPNICKHTPFDNQGYQASTSMDVMVRDNDFELVQLYFEKGMNVRDDKFKYWSCLGNLWAQCNTQKMAALLIKHDVPVFDVTYDMSALELAINNNCDTDLIRCLLEHYPGAVNGLLDSAPLIQIGLKSDDVIKNGSKGDLLVLLIDYGADLYQATYDREGWIRWSNVVEVLRDPHMGEAELAEWVQQYYHLRKDYVSIKFKTIAGLQDRLPAEIVVHILEYVGFKNTPRNLRYGEWHGSVPKAYENFRNEEFRLTPTYEEMLTSAYEEYPEMYEAQSPGSPQTPSESASSTKRKRSDSFNE